MAYSIEETPDGWEISFSDAIVSQLRVDYAFSLLLDDGAILRIEEPFDLTTAGGTTRVPGSDAVFDVAPALPLFNQQVVAIRIRRNGPLSVTFASGDRIEVPVNRQYENWNLSLPGERSFFGLPGGDVG